MDKLEMTSIVIENTSLFAWGWGVEEEVQRDRGTLSGMERLS